MKIIFKKNKTLSPFMCGQVSYYVFIYSCKEKLLELWSGWSDEIPQEYLDIEPAEIIFTNDYNLNPEIKIYINN